MRIFLLFLFSLSISFSQVSKNCAVLLKTTATAGESPQIIISWEQDEFAYEYEVLRKKHSEGNFQKISGDLDSETLSFTNNNVEEGVLYEYQVRSKSDNGNGLRWRAFGYISASVNLEAEDWKGRVLILIDETIAEPLESEITRLKIDLAKEGWGIIDRTVPRAEEYDAQKVMQTKQIILDEYNEDNNINTVFLLGRVAVPYSGGFTNSVASPPDGHGEGAGNHTGAWPSDMFYGDINSTWTDQSVNVTTSARDVNKNIPGDGKFDHIEIPSDIELAVGRVDFYNLPAFESTELELYRRYLDKNHAFRSGEMIVEKKALIDEDRFQLSNLGNREAFSSSGWRNFVPLVGYENVKSAEWTEEIFTNNYLWAYGCGAGNYTSASGVVNTNQLSSNTQNAVFTFLFGSYFGDWDSQNNLMRSALASEGNILTCGWAARPHWYVHTMGSGMPIGESLIRTQNNANGFNFSSGQYFLRNNEYYGFAVIEASWFTNNGQPIVIENGYALGFSNRQIHIALMGDPTLTQEPATITEKPTSLVAVKNQDGSIRLTWDGGPTDDIKDWDIFRANSFAGPYNKINEDVIKTETFTDEMPYETGKNVYLVKRRTYLNNNTGIRFSHGTGEIVAITQDGFLSNEDNRFNLTIGPNPTRNRIDIDFKLNTNSPVNVSIYNSSGNLVKNWNYAMLASGEHKINWDFNNLLENGVYFVNFNSNGKNISKKFVVIK